MAKKIHKTAKTLNLVKQLNLFIKSSETVALFYRTRIVRVRWSYNVRISSKNDCKRLVDSRAGFLPKAPEAKCLWRSRSDTAPHLVSIRKFLLCNHFRTLERAPANTAIRFVLRESRLAYLGSFRFVLSRYSCRGNTRYEIQVSSRERLSLPPIAITGRRCARRWIFPTFIFESLRIHLFDNRGFPCKRAHCTWCCMSPSLIW